MTRTTRPRRSARREQLVDGLIDLFLAEGFRHYSGEDLAVRLKCSKSTLYAVAPSKEQLVVAVVRSYFQRAAEHIEGKLAPETDPLTRIRVYLEGIAGELTPASREFHADLDAFAPTATLYARNSAYAAAKVRELVREAERPGRSLDSTFVGATAALVIEGIHQGRLRELTGLDDAEAYRALADLIVAATGEQG